MPRPGPIGTEQEADLLRLYASGVSRNDLARRFNASRPFVTDCLKRHGVMPRTLKEACLGLPLRHNAFALAEADPDAAYWVGFLMADGCVSAPPGKTPHVIVVLSEVDRDHLVSFRSFLGSSHAIQPVEQAVSKYNSGPCVRLDLVSQRLADDLGRYGVVPRKTATAEVRLLESNRHFWRGVIDGDGSLHLALRENYKPRPVLQLCGAKPLMAQFADFAASLTGTKARPHRSKSIWGVALSTSHAIRMIRHLYDDCTVALPRKLAKARELLEA